MSSFRTKNIGREVEVDLFGLKAPGGGLTRSGTANGTVVDLAPGAIMVRLELDGRTTDVLVGRARVSGLG